MPLWNIYHPVGAYSAEDKKEFAKRVTALYTAIPIPKFYVGIIFQEVAQDSLFIGAEPRNNFVRIRVDHIARTLPAPNIRQWWVRTTDDAIAPFVRDRGYEWEFHIDETPMDLWSINGELPPPFHSAAEARWVKDNKTSPYALGETLAGLAPGRSINSQ